MLTGRTPIGRAWPRRGALVAAVLGLGCATYQPAPVRPDSQLEGFAGRRLDNPALLAWLDSLGAGRPDAVWSVRQLALAAGWFRPDRLRWAAAIEAADAAVQAAGARPGTGLTGDVEYAFADPQATSRWGLALAGLFTLELGGKRAARLARARAEALTARAGTMQEAWTLAVRSYQATLTWYEASEAADIAAAERDAAATLEDAARARYADGGMSRLELARIEGEAAVVRASEAAAARGLAEARAAAAAAIGVPVAALVGHQPLPRAAGGCAAADSGRRAEIRREALSARWEVRGAAAAYQVAEGTLRVEVANAVPDLTLGPGLFFDQGTGKFSLASALPFLPLRRNQGRIAAAQADRTLAGTRLMEVQEQVLQEVEGAAAACSAIRDVLPAQDSAVSGAERQADLVQAAYARGETGRVELAAARLELVRARSRRQELSSELNLAGLALDRARGLWGLEGEAPWPPAALPVRPERSE